MVYAAAIFFTPNSLLIFGFLAVNLLAGVLLKADWRRQVRVLFRLLPFILFTAVFNLLLDSPAAAGYVALKLILVTQITVIYAGATTILEIGETAAEGLGFLKFLGVEPREIKLMVCVALAQLPIFKQNAREMKLALSAKGAKVNFSSTRAMVTKMGYDMLRRVNALDDGLIAKGYDD